MKTGVRTVLLTLALEAPCVRAADLPWDVEALAKPPETWPAPGWATNGVDAVFYAGEPWKGRPTRVFAFCAVPAATNGARVPGMVLVHGGGGTAFHEWVRLWRDRGYAAIAPDVCGCLPGGGHGKRPRHDDGGPPGWDASFGQIDEPVKDQWTYHAIAAVMRAHSLLRSMPGVDADRIGVTGISWGGYLTCIAAGVDARFRFAVPVYGCGFLGDNSVWLPQFESLGPERARRWLALWDPSVYLPRARMPMLWVTGSNDFAYPMDSLQKSYRVPPGPRTLCLRLRMPHGHGGAGEKPEEIRQFAEHILRGGPAPASIVRAWEEGGRAGVEFASPSPVAKAEFNFTRDGGKWQQRKWEAVPAELDAVRGKASAAVPADAKVYYFNVFDDQGRVVSSEHVTRE